MGSEGNDGSSTGEVDEDESAEGGSKDETSVVMTISEITVIATSPMLVTVEMEVVTIQAEGIWLHFLHLPLLGIHPMYMEHPPPDKKLQP